MAMPSLSASPRRHRVAEHQRRRARAALVLRRAGGPADVNLDLRLVGPGLRHRHRLAERHRHLDRVPECVGLRRGREDHRRHRRPALLRSGWRGLEHDRKTEHRGDPAQRRNTCSCALVARGPWLRASAAQGIPGRTALRYNKRRSALSILSHQNTIPPTDIALCPGIANAISVLHRHLLIQSVSDRWTNCNVPDAPGLEKPGLCRELAPYPDKRRPADAPEQGPPQRPRGNPTGHEPELERIHPGRGHPGIHPRYRQQRNAYERGEVPEYLVQALEQLLENIPARVGRIQRVVEHVAVAVVAL